MKNDQALTGMLTPDVVLQLIQMAEFIYGKDADTQGKKPVWHYDENCEVTFEDHVNGSACEPFAPHTHRDGNIKWARNIA